MSDHFPVTNSILATRTLAELLPVAYDVGPVRQIRLFSPGLNDTYRVEMADGAVYFLRVYRRDLRSRSDIGYELALLTHLRDKGVGVAWPLAARDGSLAQALEAPEGMRYVALFVEAVGREPEYETAPAQTAALYGSAVARLHNGLDDFQSRDRRSGPDLATLLDIPLRNLAPVLAYRPADWAYVQLFAERVRQRILDMPAEALEWGACHGDVQGGHLHIAPDGATTFFDFDFCGDGYRAYDLAVFRWSARFDDQELLLWEPFLRAYRAERPVSDLDIAAVPLFICARHIWHMGLHAGNAHHWGFGGLNDAYFDRRLGWLRALEADYLMQ